MYGIEQSHSQIRDPIPQRTGGVEHRRQSVKWLGSVSLVQVAEEVRHDVIFKQRHALACTINCILLAITHAYKYSWLLKPRFSRYFAGGSEGLSRLKGLLFEDEYRGAEDWAKLQGYIGEPLTRSTVDALNKGTVESIACQFITVTSWKAFGKGNVRTEPLCQVKSLDVHAGHVTS